MQFHKTKNSKSFRCASVNDQHLGSKRVPTAFKIENLKATLTVKVIQSLDVLFFNGDLFDRLLDHNSEDAILIHDFIAWLIDLCATHNTKLRVLEGTPSHDYGQNEWFVNINATHRNPCDLVYHKVPAIETLPDTHATVLYIPDKFRLDAADTWKYVEDLMHTAGLTQVDIACMHGQFTYQLPIVMISSHSEQLYLGIVRYFVLIGHIHKHTTYSLSSSGVPLIIAPGSHDRDTHGQEEPKGYVIAECDEQGNVNWEFVENTGARVFKRIDVSGWDVEAYKRHYQVLQTLPVGSNVELQGGESDIIKSMLPTLVQDIPNVRFTYDIATDWTATQRVEDDELLIGEAEVSHITADNIGELVLERLATTCGGVDDNTTDAVLSAIEEVLSWQEK